MTVQKKNISSKDTEDIISIDFKKIYCQLKKDWRRLACWGGAALVIGIIIAISIPKSYTATAELAPELSTTKSSSGLGSITSMLGLNSMGMGSDAIYPTLYPKIVQSNPFMVSLLKTQVTLEEGNKEISCSLQDYLTQHTRYAWWKCVFKWVKSIISPKAEFDTGKEIDPYHLTIGENQLIERLRGMVSISIDKKTMVTDISVTAQSPRVAADLCKTVTSLLQQNITDYRTNKAKQDVSYYETLYEEAKADYCRAQNAYAYYVDSHQGVILNSVKVEQERLQNEKNLKYQLYNSIASELQNAKAKVQLETPVFAEIVPTTIPLNPSKPRKKVVLAACILLGFAGGCVDILLFRKKEDDNLVEE